MTRLTLLFLGFCFALGFYAGNAEAAVYYQGYRVKVAQVGAIDAAPCPDPRGCLRAVLELRWHGNGTDHVVRCGHPKFRRVVGTYSHAGERWARVYACRRTYTWRIPG